MAYFEKCQTRHCMSVWWNMWEIVVAEDAKGERRDIRSFLLYLFSRWVALPVEAVPIFGSKYPITDVFSLIFSQMVVCSINTRSRPRENYRVQESHRATELRSAKSTIQCLPFSFGQGVGVGWSNPDGSCVDFLWRWQESHVLTY